MNKNSTPTPMTIYFDMDGTIADLYGTPDWESRLRTSDPTVFSDAAPMVDMLALSELLFQLQMMGVHIGIISWLSMTGSPEYNKASRQAKKDWLRAQLPDFSFDEMHIIKYDTPKERVARFPGILIDDSPYVRQAWETRDGCTAVDPNAQDIIDFLTSLLNN